MTHVLFGKCLAVVSVLVLAATGLWAAGEEEGSTAAAADKKYVTDPTSGRVFTAPEYGGTLTHAELTMAESTDIWFHGGSVTTSLITPVLEKLSIGDWGIDREEYAWKDQSSPPWAQKGALAESWEQPDPLTYVFKIRQGVHWHDKAPMNGREFDAYDVEWNYHRYYGLGSGFTEPSPNRYWDTSIVESVTATDQWTVEFKLKEPSLFAIDHIIDQWAVWIYPPEVIKEHGDAKDWRNLVGTGPYELTNVVEDTSTTYTKNPDYWAYDEKYPENRLPYIDKLVGLVMPEPATRLAALRTGKLDYMGQNGDVPIRSIDQLESLQRTNPEIVLWKYLFRSNNSFGMNVNNPPFDDIRVRQAMQMALDLETIYATYYKGHGSTRPQGQIADDKKGWSTPFEEWPEEVKKFYTYDPAGAEALLDAAGYPRGADGIRFKTVLSHFSRYDETFAGLAAAYWGEIGVDVEVQVPPIPEWAARGASRDFEMRSTSAANRYKPSGGFPRQYVSTMSWNSSAVNDPDYDAMYEAFQKADTLEEAQRLTREANILGIERHWTVWGGEISQWNVTQPWVMGYNGEVWLGTGHQDNFFARLWIDSELKKAMGH